MKKLEFGKKTLIMGILNITPDSFSDGGNFLSIDKAVEHAIQMQKDGADIIDVGGESTRPGAKTISLDEEIDRVVPVVQELVKKLDIIISVDTYKSEVARRALDIGVHMVNDVTALQGDKKLVNIIADYDVPVVLMHMKGNPRDMQKNPVYNDVVKEIYGFFKERSEYAMFCDIKKENIIVDPGLGFGKRTGRGVEDNVEILRRLSEFKKLGFPICVGGSRKTFIGNICGGKEQLAVNDRLGGSLAVACLAVINGADIIRVHDVKETRGCLDLIDYAYRS